jgi:hypothetical protein
MWLFLGWHALSPFESCCILGWQRWTVLRPQQVFSANQSINQSINLTWIDVVVGHDTRISSAMSVINEIVCRSKSILQRKHSIDWLQTVMLVLLTVPYIDWRVSCEVFSLTLEQKFSKISPVLAWTCWDRVNKNCWIHLPLLRILWVICCSLLIQSLDPNITGFIVLPPEKYGS